MESCKICINVVSWLQTQVNQNAYDTKCNKGKHLLFNFFFYYINSIFLRIEKLISGTAKVTKHIISGIIQQNIFYLKERKSIDYYFQSENGLFFNLF